ncbi:MAG: hypothetical protein ABIP94_00145 [Planctomycetota bacterium]
MVRERLIAHLRLVVESEAILCAETAILPGASLMADDLEYSALMDRFRAQRPDSASGTSK